MKSHNMDVTQGYSSDAMLHAPDRLFGLLSHISRCWLTHGTVTKSILACAFIPLVKDSDYYRGIA